MNVAMLIGLICAITFMSGIVILSRAGWKELFDDLRDDLRFAVLFLLTFIGLGAAAIVLLLI